MCTERFKSGEELPLIEEFFSIQGEGFQTGKAAYFIRLGGCDIGCKWCDSKITWKIDVHGITKVADVVERVLKTTADSVVVTGGEPCMYSLDVLCRALKEKGLKTFLETSGAYPISGEWDWICVSPKPQTPPITENYSKANELKVIISESADFEWAEKCATFIKPETKMFLQPEWSVYKAIIHDLVDYVKKNPKWMISLQAHKFMHIP